MKPRHVEAERTNARATLEWCRIPLGVDYHTLRTEQVEALLTCANLARYQKPRGANGSRSRYFHDLMQRRAR